jgi:dipeptidyl aminopeptidase/acylaminoacyl peptidase
LDAASRSAKRHDARVQTRPYGSWPSPLTAADVASAGVRLSEPALGADGSVWWLERRPQEGGRAALVRDGDDVVPEGFNVRTQVHEYGGGAWLLLGDGAVICSNWDDQRLYRIDPGGEPRPITPEERWRFADGRETPDGERLVYVRESHAGEEVANELVVLPAGGGDPEVIASGRDFYSCPRPSPDGERLCFTCWDHPNMPWDGTELWEAPLASPADARRVAGGPEESIWQPDFGPDGELWWVSDATGWWQLYRDGERLTNVEAELGFPQWQLGASTWARLDDGTIAVVRTLRGEERLCLLGADGELQELDLPYTAFGFPCLRARGERLVFVAASPREAPAVVTWSRSEGATVLRSAVDERIGDEWISVPREIAFESAGGRDAYAFYYPPVNPDCEGPEGERPPLLVQTHGGPTGHAAPELQEDVLFWTSRGFGVVDVNYGGSTGFGREYRNRLRDAWGIVDTEDSIAAAKHLAEQGEVDGEKLVIHGGSAGGYTTLCALVFHDDFSAGASYYGVADAETLAQDTHKFESRYLDGLIGPYPERADRYRERSPIHFADRLRVPVVLFQGLEDEVVPPSQAEEMVAALKQNGVPHAYLAFEGEQHGFRRAGTVIRCLEAELSFYAQVFGFEPADEIEPIELWRP